MDYIAVLVLPLLMQTSRLPVRDRERAHNAWRKLWEGDKDGVPLTQHIVVVEALSNRERFFLYPFITSEKLLCVCGSSLAVTLLCLSSPQCYFYTFLCFF